MIKFMLEYIKENPSKAAQDVVFVIGLLAMTSMLLFIGSICLTNLN